MVADVTTAILAPIGLWLLFVLIRRIYRTEHLRRHGDLTEATIRAVEIGALGEGPPFWIAKYEYTDRDGAKHDGQTPMLSFDPTARSTGNRCTIRIDPQHPERSAWVDGT